MSHDKHFTLYYHKTAPNGWKIAIVLEELGLSYESVFFDFEKGEQKNPEYVQLNPNGRIPALVDHKNNNYVTWESNAILMYLADKYDPEGKISFPAGVDKYEAMRWLFFQATGQGVYFEQAAWFTFFFPEKLPSVQDHFKKEIVRVFGVLENVLSKQSWLVGNKVTIADLSFIPWNQLALMLVADFQGFNFQTQFPATAAWHAKLVARDSVKKTDAFKASLQ